MKTKRTIIAVVVVLAVAAALVLFHKKDNKPTTNIDTIKSGTQLEKEPESETSKTSTLAPKGTILTGTLKKSDSTKQGNLMVVMEGKKLYIRTSRDYSPLLDKQVDVSYEGTLDSFVLGDIVEHK